MDERNSNSSRTCSIKKNYRIIFARANSLASLKGSGTEPCKVNLSKSFFVSDKEIPENCM